MGKSSGWTRSCFPVSQELPLFWGVIFKREKIKRGDDALLDSGMLYSIKIAHGALVRNAFNYLFVYLFI